MFVHKYLMIAVSSLVLAGCGNSDQSTSNSTGTGAAFNPSLQLLRLTPQNANDASNTLTGLEAQTTSLIAGPVDGSNGTPMGIIQNLLLAYPRLSLPQPPSDTLQVSGSTVTFSNYSTQVGTLSGRVGLAASAREVRAELQ